MIKKPTLALVAIGAGLLLNFAVQAASDIPNTPNSSTPGATITPPVSNSTMSAPSNGDASNTANPSNLPINGSTDTNNANTDANTTKTDTENKNVNLPPNFTDKIKTLNSNSPDFKQNTKDTTTPGSQ